VGFTDRADAGRQLARRLAHLRGQPMVVLGLPRGGVPVALEVARELGAPMDVIVVRKLGVPQQPELGMGAIGEDGARVINRDVVAMAGVGAEDLATVEARERVELDRRAERYRAGRGRVPLEGRTAVVVDDGIATGSTARAACEVARQHGARRVVLAVPVAPEDWIERMGDSADEYVAVATPARFRAVGQFYEDFSQTTDEEVVAALQVAASRHEPAAPTDAGASGQLTDEEVEVEAGPVRLPGTLRIPLSGARGVVIFAHGSGSSRHSPRNRYVASVLHEAGLGTLLFDLLTRSEEQDRSNVFDIDLLGRRLVQATAWLGRQPSASGLPVGYFGASTGAGAALWAAADAGDGIAAVVSRGGRPDLAGPRLAAVRAPTLLVVGGHDEAVLELNRRAAAQFSGRCQVVVVRGASHLFEEPGTLQAAAELARDWFVTHCAAWHPARRG
jgi:putative phosphoribosyl transferase